MFNLNKVTELNKKIDSLFEENNKLNTINKDYIISNKSLQRQIQEHSKNSSFESRIRLLDQLS